MVLAYAQALSGPAHLAVRSPGRINLIGEHTDYHDGLVLPGAIDRAITLAFRRLPQGRACRAIALDLDEASTFDPAEVAWGVNAELPGWARFVQGVAAQLHRQQSLPPFEVAFAGNVPIGAGMSSSAALCCGMAFGLNHLFAYGLDRPSLARLAQQTEHVFAGLRVGIMDQMANLQGRAGQFLLLDCRTLETQPIPANLGDAQLLLLNSHVKHELVSTEYNQRRQQGEQAVARIRHDHPHVRALRDVTPALLAQYRDHLAPLAYRRCAYVVAEIQRVRDAVQALQAGDLPAVGTLLNSTHAGLRDDYNVSTPELDLLQDLAAQHPGVYGSRLMGGGFGGCTLNLVRRDAVADVQARLSEAYQQRFGMTPSAYACTLTDGTSVITG